MFAIIGAILGWYLTKGNLIGGAVGGYIGYMIDASLASNDKESNRKAFKSAGANAFDFGNYLMMLTSLVIKADGVTLKSELNYVKQFFVKQFGEAQAKQHVLNLKKYLETDISLDKVAREIEKSLNSSSKIHLLHYLIGIAHADGDISSTELHVIKQIANALNIPQQTLDSILAMFYYQSGGNTNQGNYSGGTKTASYRIDNAYQILSITSSSTDEEVKKAYRKLAIKYHPDKVAQLGPEFQQGAKEKFQKVQEAYELIKEKRGFK